MSALSRALVDGDAGDRTRRGRAAGPNFCH